jgi:hypothetical protein
MYKQFLPKLLNTKTVGQLKQSYPAFRKYYEAYMPKKEKWAAWEKLVELLRPLESTFGCEEGQGAAALPAPPVQQWSAASSSASAPAAAAAAVESSDEEPSEFDADTEPEVTGRPGERSDAEDLERQQLSPLMSQPS